MDDNSRANVAQAILEMKESLDAAVSKAGGSPVVFSVLALRSMSALDLMVTLSTNSVRFSYEGPPKNDAKFYTVNQGDKIYRY